MTADDAGDEDERRADDGPAVIGTGGRSTTDGGDGRPTTDGGGGRPTTDGGGGRPTTDGGGGSGWTWDLAGVVALVAITAVVLLVVDAPWLLEWAVGLPFLLVLPGYGIVAALFPERTRVPAPESRGGATPGPVVRFALSVMLSGVLVAVVGVLLDLTVGIRLAPAVLALGVLAVAGASVAAVRRRGESTDPDGSQPTSPPGLWERSSPGTTLQTAAMALALVVLVSTVAFTGATPSGGGASYTEFYLLSEDGDGELTAANYSETYTTAGSEPLHVGIENHEGTPVSYEVVTLAQVVDADGSVAVQQEVDRFDVRLDDGENAAVERDVGPTIVGDEIRLQVLLYRGDAPERPSTDSADQSLHLWVDVVDES